VVIAAVQHLSSGVASGGGGGGRGRGGRYWTGQSKGEASRGYKCVLSITVHSPKAKHIVRTVRDQLILSNSV
jgi:hypothetical protein